MKRLTLILAFAAVASSQIVRAQNLVSAFSLSGSVAASTASYDYRYTKHTISAGGRGGRTTTYYTWDPYLDQSTTTSFPLQFGVMQGATSVGTFYGPVYSAGATAFTSFTTTPTQAVLTVSYTGTTTATTTLGAHQSVTVTAQPGSTFTFTLTGWATVSVTTTGTTDGVFRLFGPGMGVILGPLYGAAGPVIRDTPLAPGTYWVTNSLTTTSGINAQTGTITNPGTTSTAWGFTMTLTPSEPDNGGGN